MISIVFWDGIPNLWHSLWINPTFCIIYDFTRSILQHSPSYRLQNIHLPSQYRIMNDLFSTENRSAEEIFTILGDGNEWKMMQRCSLLWSCPTCVVARWVRESRTWAPGPHIWIWRHRRLRDPWSPLPAAQISVSKNFQ